MSATEAAEFFVARQKHESWAAPQGKMEEDGWFPTEAERQDCCGSIHPSQKNRQALQQHCRTLVHVAKLTGVDPKELAAEAARIRAEEPAAPEASPVAAVDLAAASEGAVRKAVEKLKDEARELAKFLAQFEQSAADEEELAALVAALPGRLDQFQKAVALVTMTRASLVQAREVVAAFAELQGGKAG